MRETKRYSIDKSYKENYDLTAKCVKAKWDTIAKPIDSLGMLEDYVVKLCAISGSTSPYELGRRAVVSMCADHGVVCEGVTQTGSEVTRIVAENFAGGCSCVNYMSAIANADVFAIDMGMDTEEYPNREMVTGAIINRKIARGTKNLAVESAMSIDECIRAIDAGIDTVARLKEQGYSIIATGEMGIGNTTPTSVLAALMLNLSAEEVTGRGAGLDNTGLDRKIQVVKKAISRVRNSVSKDEDMTIRILAEAGGFEIAGMAGLFLGGAKYRLPIIIDGAISAISALVASRIDSSVADFALASHVSEELTGRLALEELKLEAILKGHMCLGEGSGAVAIIPLLDMGMNVYRNMGTFAELSIDAYDRSGKPQCESTGT